MIEGSTAVQRTKKPKPLIRLAKRLDTYLHSKIISKRLPDFVIFYDEKLFYLRRWFVIPRNRFFNIYLHEFNAPDPDYTLHDHPWFSLSFVLFSSYTEQQIKYGGSFTFIDHKQGDLIFRSPWFAHRISAVMGNISRTLFITGPVVRTWGFHNNVMGWLDYMTYKERMSKHRRK